MLTLWAVISNEEEYVKLSKTEQKQVLLKLAEMATISASKIDEEIEKTLLQCLNENIDDLDEMLQRECLEQETEPSPIISEDKEIESVESDLYVEEEIILNEESQQDYETICDWISTAKKGIKKSITIAGAEMPVILKLIKEGYRCTAQDNESWKISWS